MCQIMYIGMVGQGTGTLALASPLSTCDCNNPGTVAKGEVQTQTTRIQPGYAENRHIKREFVLSS